MTTVYTVGHSTRGADEFGELLTTHGIELVVDVRQFPGSRRFPHFSALALRERLASRGIDYVHEMDLGGRRRGNAESPNTYWRNASFRAFADYMASDRFRAALERLVEHAGQRRVAIMCAEAVPWRCHRWLISDALVARGIQAQHILDSKHLQPHVLNSLAQRGADGTLVYPASADTSPD
jgi:uncharacterized protein (DUF488 family)